MLQAGSIVGGTYQVLSEIGHGGTSVVYLAYHINLQKYTVLKRITRQISNMESLRREVDILKNLRHTNIPQIYNFIIEDGEVFTVMDYIEGVSLDKYIGGANYHSENQLIRWFSELTDVLVYLSSRKPPVIHSDIKPENIIITPQGIPVLIDFNISIGENSPGKVVGFSRHYASPEQGYMVNEIQSGRMPSYAIDERTDIYSLGAVFYTLITGIIPDCSRVMVPLETMQGLLYSQAFLAMIDKCVSWDRNKRFRNAGKLSAAVANLYRMDRNYRKYTALRVSSWILSAAVFAGGCFCVLHGIQINISENIRTLFDNTNTALQIGDYQTAAANAEEILSHIGYKWQLEDNQLASVYHALGSSEYAAGSYQEAAADYRKALDTLGGTGSMDTAAYQSDLALAYLRSGDMQALDDLLGEITREGMESDDLQLVRAAALQQKGDAEGSRQIAESIINGTGGAEAKAKACIIAAQCFDDSRTADKLAYMRKATEYSSEMRYLRECAALEYGYAGKPGLSEYQRKVYAENAAKLYEKICSVPSPQVIDQINLGISYYYAGQYQKALNVLNKAAGNSKYYKISMYQALASEEAGDYSEARNYCSDAINACRNEQNQSQEVKEDLETLEALAERLY